MCGDVAAEFDLESEDGALHVEGLEDDWRGGDVEAEGYGGVGDREGDVGFVVG